MVTPPIARDVLLERGVVRGRLNRGSKPSGVLVGEGKESDISAQLSLMFY
jgi:hypothetical protein